MANENPAHDEGMKDRAEGAAHEAGHRARQQAEHFREQARQRAEQARGAAGETAEHLRHEAEELGQEARGIIDGFVRSAFSGLAERARAVSKACAHAADDLEQGEMDAAGRYARQASERTNRASDYLESADLDRVVDDSADFARKNPEVVLGAAFVVGLGISRFIKASQERREHEELRRRSQGQGGSAGGGSGGGSAGSSGEHSASGADELRHRAGIAEPVEAGTPRWTHGGAHPGTSGAGPAGEPHSPGRGTAAETSEASGSGVTNTGRAVRAEDPGATPTSSWHAQRQHGEGERESG